MQTWVVPADEAERARFRVVERGEVEFCNFAQVQFVSRLSSLGRNLFAPELTTSFPLALCYGTVGASFRINSSRLKLAGFCRIAKLVETLEPLCDRRRCRVLQGEMLDEPRVVVDRRLSALVRIAQHVVDQGRSNLGELPLPDVEGPRALA